MTTPQKERTTIPDVQDVGFISTHEKAMRPQREVNQSTTPIKPIINWLLESAPLFSLVLL